MIEHEWKLTVQDDVPGGPEAFFAHVAEQRTLGGYRVVARGSHLLDDTYWDLPGLPIARAKAGLRLRNQDGTLLVTWKQGEATRGGEFRREEYEAPLSAQTWAEVQSRAALLGITLPAGTADMQQILGVRNPRTVLTLARPDRRLGAEPGTPPEPVVLLCLDRVEYHGKPGCFYDVELELTGAGEPADGRSLVRALQSLAGPDWLVPAAVNKLQRGMGL